MCPKAQYLLSIPVSASAAPRGNLDSAKVHQVRTGRLTDSHHSRLFGVSIATVRDARIGKTWTDHPTPPDMAPRTGGGATVGAKRKGGTAQRDAIASGPRELQASLRVLDLLPSDPHQRWGRRPRKVEVG
jgi:hypothetical protein